MKSLKLAKSATVEILSDAICYGAVKISEGVYLATGAYLPKLLSHDLPEPGSKVGNIEIRSMDFYLYSPLYGIEPVDIETIEGLNQIIELVDSECYDSLAQNYDSLVKFREHLHGLEDYDVDMKGGSMFADDDLFALARNGGGATFH